MKSHPHHGKGAHHIDPAIERKHSLIKPPHFQITPLLELPRFYSSDEKIKRKNIIIQTEHHLPSSPQQTNHEVRDNAKRTTIKCAKTEKNQTPSKGEATALNKVKIIQEKLGEAILKGHNHETNKPKIRQKKMECHDIIHTEKNEARTNKETTQTATESTNQNKIRYKIHPKKNDAQLKHPHKRSSDGLEIQTDLPKTIRQAVRQSKAQTEECLKNPLKEKSKVVFKNEQITDMMELKTHVQPGKKEQKLRTVSTFETVLKGKHKLTQHQKDHLKLVQQIVKKTIKNPSNLDYPQSYIVCDKLKFEKKYIQYIQPKHHKQFKKTLVLTRLSFYLCAYFILESTPTKPLVNLFSKVLQAHQTIMSLLISNEDRANGDKYFSINKYSTKDLPKRDGRQHIASEMAVQTRGNNLPRTNDSIKRQLINFFNAKDCSHSELFLRILSTEVEDGGVQMLGEMDKELKWQVLKMPTSPFLPQAHPAHKHYLILDLDETLIHFNPSKQTYQVRPHASDFLQNLSRYYQLTVFTAATKEYADDIINSIDNGGFVSHRLYRNHLTFLMGESLKDISMLGRHLPATLIVDNLQGNFRLHPDNGITIKSWYGCQNDAILPKLQNLLIRIALEFPQDLRKGVSLYSNYIAREITERVRAFKIKYDV